MKVIGIMTENFQFFYKLVQMLRDHNEPFIVLNFDEEIPLNVGVIATTKEERSRVKFHRVVAENSPRMAYRLAHSRLKGRESFVTLVIGIDPGRRPGLAIIGDGKIILAETVNSPESVADIVTHFSRGIKHDRLLARVGHGDPTNRDRVICSIWNIVDDVEVVDERGTTRRTEEPDADAAVSIALSTGRRLPFPPTISPTVGEIRDIQRQSRIESEGRLTISSELAEAVARGDITLPDALKVQGRKSSR